MGEATHERGDTKFAEALGQMQEIGCANLVLDAGIMNGLKTVVCFLMTPQLSDCINPSCLAAEREFRRRLGG
jgi:hypothetical protein